MDSLFNNVLLPQDIIDKFSLLKTNCKYKSTLFEEPDTDTLILVPSERCNLKCKYCYETEKSPLRLDFDTAIAAISKKFSELPLENKLKIEFRGGEPFLEFSIIKKICNWTFENYKNENYFFYAISNGTCFSEESKQWLAKNKERFIVALSIDGEKKTQDANRSNSFDLIDFQFIYNTWNNPYAFTTLLPENANSIFRDLLFLLKNGFTIRANFEIVHTWNRKQLYYLSAGLKKLADFIIQNEIQNKLNLFSRQSFLDYNLENSSIDRKYFIACNAGRHRQVLTADGNIYPCQAMVPSCFNHYGKENGINLFYKLTHEEMNPEKCCKCKYFFLCYICVGFSYSYAKDFKWRNESFCEITRIRTFVAAYYWGKYLSTKKSNLLTEQELVTIQKIVDLYAQEKIYASNI